METAEHRGRRWGTRAVAAVIAVQVAIPAVAALQEPPARFGFQMYSGYSGTLTVLDADGREIEFDHGELFTQFPRAELSWETRVADHLCAEVDRAAAVSIVQGRRAEQVITCP